MGKLVSTLGIGVLVACFCATGWAALAENGQQDRLERRLASVESQVNAHDALDLRASVTQLDRRVSALVERTDTLETTVGRSDTTRTAVTSLAARLSRLESESQDLQTKVDRLEMPLVEDATKSDISALKSQVVDLQTDVGGLDGRVREVCRVLQPSVIGLVC